MNAPTLENGFARLPAGDWLVGQGQPVAYEGTPVWKGIRGWIAPDRFRLRHLVTTEPIWCSAAKRPFLTHMDCATTLTVVTEKLLAMPADGREKGALLKVIPMSFRSALCTTVCRMHWAVMSTASRTQRVTLKEGEVLSVHREAVVAWTTRQPTGFCPRIRLRDILLPKVNRTALFLNFYGPGVVWMEGA